MLHVLHGRRAKSFLFDQHVTPSLQLIGKHSTFLYILLSDYHNHTGGRQGSKVVVFYCIACSSLFICSFSSAFIPNGNVIVCSSIVCICVTNSLCLYAYSCPPPPLHKSVCVYVCLYVQTRMSCMSFFVVVATHIDDILN